MCFTALARAEIMVNKDYSAINPPQPTETGKKIEVIEFFYYGCSHCFNLEPILEVWLKQKPKDVEFRRVPIVFRDSWVTLTKAFYAFEALGLLDKMHHDFFVAIHEGRLNSTKKAIAAWANARGVDAKRFSDAYDSFGVQSKTQKSTKIGRDYNVTGTPALAVDGKYLTAPSMMLTSGNLINYRKFVRVLNELIVKARTARSAQPELP